MNIQNNKNVDDILGSLDSVKRASAPDFFYTRLKARMEKGVEPVAQRPWILRPAFAFTALVLVVLINAAVIFQGQNSTETNSADTDTYQSIAAEYNLNDSMLEEVYK